MSFARYAIGLCHAGLGCYLGLHPHRLGRIGFGAPEGAVPTEMPPLPKWVGRFIAIELFCSGVAILSWYTIARKALFVGMGAFLFLITWSVTAIVAGVSARQAPGFTLKTASRVRSYRATAFVYAAIGFAMLILLFVLPLIRHR